MNSLHYCSERENDVNYMRKKETSKEDIFENIFIVEFV